MTKQTMHFHYEPMALARQLVTLHFETKLKAFDTSLLSHGNYEIDYETPVFIREIISEEHISEVLNINNLEDAEKILAAEFYTLNAKKCKNKMKMETLVFKSTDEQYSEFKLISEQYKEEFQTITKQFLTETPREFLRLNNFEVVEQ